MWTTATQKPVAIFAVVLMLLVAAACGRADGEETPEPTRTLAEAPTAQGRCGDGVCDEAEQEDPSLCPQDCAPTAVPTEAPTAERKAAEPAGKCGDGECDEAEQQDPSLCPQDCGHALAGEPTRWPKTGTPDYEPPINVTLILHIDPLGDQESETFKPEPGMYRRTRDEIDLLAEEGAQHGMRFTALYNGWYPQWALKEGDTGQFRVLLDGGHEIGSHAHRITYDAETDTWIKRRGELDLFGRPNYSPEVARQCWRDAAEYVDTVLTEIGAAGQNRTMCATALTLSDEKDLMGEFGFTIAAGNRMEKGMDYFGHMVWNPWRAANSDEPGYELAGDPNANYVTFNHLAQIGGGGSIGMPAEAHGQDLTVPQMQRRFLMLYTEWLSRERTGAQDRVWTFGFVYHPNCGDRYNAELAAFLDWLDEHFIGQTSPYGHTIARYATLSEVADEFYTWEAAHPGASSFGYARGDPYPYTYATVANMLGGAAYEAPVDLGQGVSCFRFSKEGERIYLAWSDGGERTVDLSTQVSGQVVVADMTGETSVQEASTLTLTPEPVLVEPAP